MAPEESVYCTRCGTAVAPDEGYCPSCGAAVTRGPVGTGSGPAPRPAVSPAAAVVMLLFLAAGTAAIFTVLEKNQPPSRAVPGSPSSQGRGDLAADVPAGHPSVELPQEMVQVLEDLRIEAEKAPSDVEAWVKLARARYRAGRLNHEYLAQAHDAYGHVLEIDPKNREALRTQGNIAYEQKDFATAAAFYKRYLEMDPDHIGVATDLGSALLFQGEIDEALDTYRKVIAKDPDFVPAHVNLGIALHGNGRTEEAKAEFDKALDLAKTPDERAQIEQIVAAAQGQSASNTGQNAETAPALSTNATSPFQHAVDTAFSHHPIFGSRVVEITWSAPATANIVLAGFPMDDMPQVMRNKFKATLNKTVAELAHENDVSDAIDIVLVDQASKRVMDRLDGKEFIDVFDEARYE